VEQVAHAVHEDAARALPPQRVGQVLDDELHFACPPRAVLAHDREAVVRLALAAEPGGDPLGVAVLAPWRDARAAAHGVPGGVSPSNPAVALIAHGLVAPNRQPHVYSGTPRAARWLLAPRRQIAARARARHAQVGALHGRRVGNAHAAARARRGRPAADLAGRHADTDCSPPTVNLGTAAASLLWIR
jgi:hypothetical protein